MTEEINLQENNHSNKLTLSEVKDCGYARECRRSILLTLFLFVLLAGLIALMYFILRDDDTPNARWTFLLVILYCPILIYQISRNVVGLRRLYSNYEKWELVTCEIWNASSMDGNWQSQRYDRRAITHHVTFTTADGTEHKLTSHKVKKVTLFAPFQLDRYNGNAQFLYDAENDELYPFTPLPKKVKKK